MKISTFIATTKDGFISTENGDISFLDNLNINGDAGYQEYYDSIDVLVYGSKSFEKVVSFNLPEWLYKTKKSFVLTTNPTRYKYMDDVEFINSDVRGLVARVSPKYNHMWVMGGANVINQFMQLDLLDELHISRTNKVLENGIKLFEDESILNKYSIKEKIDYGDITTTIYIRK